jgi:hypothetical protein
VDELYRLPLGEFTAARNALAKSLGGAQAKDVKALAKPTVVPWTVNQLYWRDRKTYDRLMQAGAALRSAQIAALKGRAADIRTATETHRTAVGEAVKSAVSLAAAQGSHPAADQLARMLEAISLSPSAPEPPGRLTELVQPSGFEALAGVTPAASVFKPAAASGHHAPRGDHADGSRDGHDGHAARQPSATGRKSAAAAPREADRVDSKAIRAAQKKREAEERRRARARAAAEARAQKTIAAAEREVERARAALAAAEKKLAAARSARLTP